MIDDTSIRSTCITGGFEYRMMPLTAADVDDQACTVWMNFVNMADDLRRERWALLQILQMDLRLDASVRIPFWFAIMHRATS